MHNRLPLLNLLLYLKFEKHKVCNSIFYDGVYTLPSNAFLFQIYTLILPRRGIVSSENVGHFLLSLRS